MKILCISDTHTKHDKIPSVYLENADNAIDMIIHAGDVSSRGTETEIINFLEWYDKLPFKYKIFIPGNHDFFFEESDNEMIIKLLSNYPSITYLNDSGIEIEGIKIWGSPITPYFHNWAFNRIGYEINKHWDLIPLDTNILITHGPMFGYLDLTLQGIRSGCEFLRERLPDFTDLKMHICGHIHEAYGEHEFVDGKLFLNASVLNRRYEMQNRPIFIEYGNNYSLELGYIIK
jgi:Icc-related predicted phosphoesterase